MTSPVQTSMTTGALTDTAVPAIAPPSSAALAVNVASVKMHISVFLDLQASNFAKWDMLLGVLLGRYELTGHIFVHTPAATRDAERLCQDITVRSCLYGSISDDILDTIMGSNQTAYVTYTLICNLFLDNQLTHAVYLEAEFSALA
nr:uncharacterized protein LOC127303379 [Lolium perenne]